MYIVDVRHDFPVVPGFLLDRPQGRNYYIFAHYLTPVTLTLADREFQLDAGAMVFIAPNTPHQLYCESTLLHNWFHVHATSEELAERYQIPVNEPFYCKNSDHISQKVRCMEVEFFSREEYRETMLEMYIHEFFISLMRSYRSNSTPLNIQKPLEKTMAAIRRSMLSHPHLPWNIDQLAEMASLSNSHFHAVYKTLFGTSPTQDLIDARIDNAKNILRNQPNLTIKQAAEQLGYNDQYHFIRQFKSVTGKTPGAYKKQHCKPPSP